MLAYHKLTDEWEVWDTIFEVPVKIASRPASAGFDLEKLIMYLRDHTHRRKPMADVVEKMMRENDAMVAAHSAAVQEKAVEVAKDNFWKVKSFL